MIELQCLNYIFQTNSFHIVLMNGIDETYFYTYREQFNFIKDYYDKYNQLPSKETFQDKFSDSFEWIAVTDPESYIVSQLIDNKMYRTLADDFNKAIHLIKDGKTADAVNVLTAATANFQQVKQTGCIDLIDDAKIRYDNYVAAMGDVTNAFVKTGLKELDEILGGWDVKNESAIIAARTGVGKSWWLIYFAVQAAKQGRQVGYYSGEMDSDLVGYRLDTIMSHISNKALTRADDRIQLQYKTFIDNINQHMPGHIYCLTPDMVDGPVTVPKIRAFIEKYNIDFMCIDQLSLLDDARHGRTPREQMANISKDLRVLQRLKKIPMLSAAQLNREETEHGPSTRNISESDRIGQDATTILFIEKQEADNLVITVGKARNAKTGDKLTYAWTIDTSELLYIATENDAKKGEDIEKIANEYVDSKKLISDVF